MGEDNEFAACFVIALAVLVILACVAVLAGYPY